MSLLVLGIGVLLVVTTITAVCLSMTHRRAFIGDRRELAERIDALLPQTQCGQCGFAGCMPYAQAIAHEVSPINRCPPGGDGVIVKLAEMLGEPIVPLAADLSAAPPAVAVIDREICIGCTKCIPPCPTDAIVGSAGQLHDVITERCTGCALCLPPCPVDCIDLVPVPAFTSGPAGGDCK